MIDHDTARQSLSTSLDFPIEPDEREALDEHLRDCPACRSFAAAARGDAATLRELDFGPVPIAVRANLAIAAERQGGGTTGRWVALVAVGALLLAGLGGGVLGVGGRPAGSGDPGPTDPAAGPMQVAWKTEVATLTARDFAIIAGGQTFRATVPNVAVRSDPGDANSRTLEAAWIEHGVEMRLGMYFGGDATAWWVDEVRIYNGAVQGRWLYAKGPLFKTPLGGVWTGDQDITMIDVDGGDGGAGQVHFGGLTLASRPADNVNVPPDGGVPLPADSRPFDPGGPLHCAGILQMNPARAQQALQALGYRVSWRHIMNDGTYVELLKEPPTGTIIVPDGPFVGTEGQILIAIIDRRDRNAVPVPLPADCPVSDPNLTPPPPAP